MLQNVLNKLGQVSRWPVLWVLLGMYCVFGFWLMPMLAHSDGVPANATPPLDLAFSYSVETAFAHVQSLQESGRQLSAFMHLTLDVAYPIVYSLLFAVILTMSTRYVTADGPWAQRVKYLPLLPFVILVFDLLENICIAFLMWSWPQPSSTLAHMGSLATSAKWSLVALVLSLVLVFLVSALFRRLKTSR
jgi:hypothetical protein